MIDPRHEGSVVTFSWDGLTGPLGRTVEDDAPARVSVVKVDLDPQGLVTAVSASGFRTRQDGTRDRRYNYRAAMSTPDEVLAWLRGQGFRAATEDRR